MDGSFDGIVGIEPFEPSRAATLGLPVRLKRLPVSLESLQTFLAALRWNKLLAGGT